MFRSPHLNYWYFTFGLFRAGPNEDYIAFGGYDFYVCFSLRYSLSFYPLLETYLLKKQVVCPVEFLTVWILLLASWCSSVLIFSLGNCELWKLDQVQVHNFGGNTS